MISLDQVLLLQEKVETAVLKIASLNAQVRQLTTENDALRSKCAELTKALSDKSELVSSLESDQVKIEQGILNALSRLDTVENAILSVSGSDAVEQSAEENVPQEIEVPTFAENNFELETPEAEKPAMESGNNGQLEIY